MRTIEGLQHEGVDLITAAIGWVELGEATKAIAVLKRAVGTLQEATILMRSLLADAEPSGPALG